MSTTALRPTEAAAPRRTSRRRPPGFALFTAALALVGLLVLLYPGTAAWVSQYNQSQIIRAYSSEMTTLAPNDQNAAVQMARSYNAQLTGGAQLAAGERVPLSDGSVTPDQFDYARLLRVDGTGLMARLKIPSIGIDLPIYHGTSDATLLQGVGHLEGTALPVGGVNTHSVLTAHRGLASAELFTHLDRVGVGDTFTIEVFGEVLSYQVVETKVIEPNQTESLFPRVGHDLVTLVTCTPLGINSHRILVTAERITPTPIVDLETAGQAPDVPGFPWWAAGLGAGIVVIVAYLWWTARWAPARSRAGASPFDPDPTDAEGPPLPPSSGGDRA